MVRKSKKLPRHLIVPDLGAMGTWRCCACAAGLEGGISPILQVYVATRPLFVLTTSVFWTSMSRGAQYSPAAYGGYAMAGATPADAYAVVR